jgi:hypothetical protein
MITSSISPCKHTIPIDDGTQFGSHRHMLRKNKVILTPETHRLGDVAAASPLLDILSRQIG